MSRSASQTLAVVLAVVPVGAAGLILLISLYGLLAQCDESCTGGDWHHTAGAWQWKGLVVLGALIFVLAVAFFVFVLHARPWPALAALAVSALVTLMGFAWTGDNWNESLERHPPLMAVIALTLGSGIFAALLCASARRDAAD